MIFFYATSNYYQQTWNGKNWHLIPTSYNRLQTKYGFKLHNNINGKELSIFPYAKQAYDCFLFKWRTTGKKQVQAIYQVLRNSTKFT